MSTFLKRSDPRPPKTAVVEIPEWNGAVKVRGLPLGLLFAAKDGASDGNERELGIKSILACVLDEDGKPFFEKAEDVDGLDLPIFTRLQNAIAELSKADPVDIAKN